MKTRAAVLWGLHQDWKVEEIELDPPEAGEVLVKWEAAGLCHSDEHLVTGDMVVPEEIRKAAGLPESFPIIGGHEGAGIVLEVGPEVKSLQVGDHIAASFFPACGRCRYCVTGRTNLCDLGAGTFGRGQISDGTDRHHIGDQPVSILAKLGTFAEHSVINEMSAIKVAPDLPMTAVALVSCGVTTGFGSAVHRAEVQPGETVVVVGTGGVGMNAVQGARIAGARNIIAVDPVELKRETAQTLGATHSAASMADAMPLVQELTFGQMADAVILTPGVLYGDLLGQALSLTGKGGTTVVTAIAPMTQTQADINLFELAMWQKEVKGVIFGAGNPRFDIPNLLALYQSGQLKLDELITRTYSLDGINDGYQDMRDGKNIRGVLVMK
ncbi:MAG TPA: NDMA-dependent alcohol dehydrogenase [Acidimicrobiales bacterium]|nr:NDMA-dependent alcohol dehydrogenase [Acidimicrobiales bacterium]